MDLNLLYAPSVLIALVGAAGIFVIFLSIVRSPRLRGVKKILSDDLARSQPVEAEGPSWTQRLQAHLDQADLNVGAGEFLRIVFVSALASLFVGWLLLGGPMAGGICGVLAFLLYWTYLEDRRDRRRQAYQEALPDVVDHIRASYTVSAGTALVTVFAQLGADPKVVDGRIQSPPIPIVQPDFKRMEAQLRLNTPLEAVLRETSRRRHDVILDMVFEALLLQQNVRGTEVAVTLGRLADAVRALIRIRRRIRAEQTKITWEGRVMCLAPFAFLFLIQVTAPAYSRPFFASPLGQLAILAAGALSLAAYFLARRIANRVMTLLERREYPSLYTPAQLDQSLRQPTPSTAARAAATN